MIQRLGKDKQASMPMLFRRLPTHTAAPLATVVLAFLLGCAGATACSDIQVPAANPAPGANLTLRNTAQAGFPFPPGTAWAYSRVDYHQVIGDPTQIIKATSLYTETVVRVEGTAPPLVVLLERSVSQATVPPGWESWTILEPGQYRYRIEGNQILEIRSPNNQDDVVLYDFPLAADKRWCLQPWQPANASGCNEMGRREVQGRSSYTTAVGTFSECYEILDQYYIGGTEWFCDGVGVVARKYDHSGTRFGYEDTLVHFSLGTPPP